MTWTWEWQAHAEAWLLAAALEAGYLGALAVLGPRHAKPPERPATRGQMVLFTLGVLFVWLASDWPIHDLAEGLYGVHMLQHLLLALAAPPLMLLGTPGWLADLVLSPSLLRRTVRALTRPITALVIFNTVLALVHLPSTVGLMARSEGAHLALHAALVGSAFLMWIPVLSPTERLPRLSPAGSMVYLLAQAVLPMFLASFLSLARLPLFLPYAARPGFFGVSPLLDQKIAGAVMGAGGLLLGLTGVLVWVRGGGPESPRTLPLSDDAHRRAPLSLRSPDRQPVRAPKPARRRGVPLPKPEERQVEGPRVHDVRSGCEGYRGALAGRRDISASRRALRSLWSLWGASIAVVGVTSEFFASPLLGAAWRSPTVLRSKGSEVVRSPRPS